MRIFIQALDYDMQRVITRGPHTSTIKINGVSHPKSKKDWDEFDKKMTQLNAKIINILYYSLDIQKFNRTSTCISAKKIGDKLKITHKKIS